MFKKMSIAQMRMLRWMSYYHAKRHDKK